MKLERFNVPIEDLNVFRIPAYTDDRGVLLELWRMDENEFDDDTHLALPAMAYISTTKPGVIRGPHEHKDQTDRFTFADGIFKMYLWENRKGKPNYREQLTLILSSAWPTMVEVPPGVVHAYANTGTSQASVLNFPDRLFAGEEKKEEVDEIRWETDPNSPFKVDIHEQNILRPENEC